MKRTAVLALLALSGATFAQTTFNESEPNDTKATADSFTVAPGDSLAGVTQSNEIDRYNLNFAAAPRAIYFNTLTTSGSGFTGGLKGLALTSTGAINPASDPTAQFLVAPENGTTRINRFYTFGQATSVGFEIAGTGNAVNYTVDLTQSVVTPTAVGTSFLPGAFTINAGGNSIAQDTDIVLYDSQSNAIGTNNDLSTTTFASRLTLNLAPGTYTLAISDGNLIANLGPDANEALNEGPDSYTNVFENAGVLASFSSTQGLSLPLTISDGQGGTYSASYSKTTRYGVGFYQFTVAQPVPEPATMAALGLGALALIKRRRK